MSTPHAPLAERMRPKQLTDIIGQRHLVGPDGAITRFMAAGVLPSMIFWGPPGVGKTTLGRLIADAFNREFYLLNAITSGVKDIREVIERAEKSGFMGQVSKPLVFIDEIHRFNKSQQDSLLAAVEKGTISLIGATTENPSFEVNQALLSRCQVFTLAALQADELLTVMQHALTHDEWLKQFNITIAEHEALLLLSGGDARKLLNYLEIVVAALAQSGEVTITNEAVKQAVQHVTPVYDKSGEMHYDIVSAFIKSMRGSDPNAAVYWLARMIEGGEDPKFIARRMLILASEDIGIANPNALLMATNCFEAVSMIGYPEAQIILSQTAVYLATSAKSNSTYVAIKKARQLVQQTGSLPVPIHLRNAPTQLMKDLNYGAGYLYAHDYPGNFVEQEFLPDAIQGTSLYIPGQNAREAELKNFMKQRWKDKYRLTE